MNFKNKIQALCRERGILQKELAHKIGVHEYTFARTLKQDNIQIKTLEKIAAALNVHIGELFEYEKRPKFLALIDNDGKFYRVESLEELERYVQTWKSELSGNS